MKPVNPFTLNHAFKGVRGNSIPRPSQRIMSEENRDNLTSISKLRARSKPSPRPCVSPAGFRLILALAKMPPIVRLSAQSGGTHRETPLRHGTIRFGASPNNDPGSTVCDSALHLHTVKQSHFQLRRDTLQKPAQNAPLRLASRQP